MASTDGAEKRIKYVTGQGPYQGTPNTITGSETEVYSYAMRIAHKDPETGVWHVVPYEDGPSRTTKRHIRAANWALR